MPPKQARRGSLFYYPKIKRIGGSSSPINRKAFGPAIEISHEEYMTVMSGASTIRKIMAKRKQK